MARIIGFHAPLGWRDGREVLACHHDGAWRPVADITAAIAGHACTICAVCARSSSWRCYRFLSPADDPRPRWFPPPGPYWITGYTDEGTQLVAYFPTQDPDDVHTYWPEAVAIEGSAVTALIFTARFPRPAWWPEAPKEEAR